MADGEQNYMQYVYAALLLLVTVLWSLYSNSVKDNLDYKKYTKAKLGGLMDELELTYCSIYARNYALMRRSKQNGSWKPYMKEKQRGIIVKAIQTKKLEVVNDYRLNNSPQAFERDEETEEPISLEQFEKWAEHFEPESGFLQK